MASSADDETEPGSFPTYSALAQTQGWSSATSSSIAELVGAAPSDGPRYREGTILGTGGMGQVLLAQDSRIGRDVAVKVLRSDRDFSDDDRARFLREAQVQGQLEHPSIVPVYDIDRRPDGSTFFTMRRVLGRTLHEILDDLRLGRATHTQRELLQAFATVCLTIDYAHSRGVVHRDLKPANIMLGHFGEVYVLDWGLARVLGGASLDQVPATRLSIPGSMMGTPLYMAPEQMAAPDVGPSADVFALGALLFELLTYERLRDTSSVFAPVDARTSVRAPDRKVPPELETICVRATELEPSLRHSSARALHDEIGRYLEGDRALEQRRTSAAAHSTRAREALERASRASDTHDDERATAMRELVRAISLDPTNREHVVVLAEIIDTPPRTIPDEVQTRINASGQGVVRAGASYIAMATLSWIIFLPLILGAGVRRYDYLAWIMVPALVTVGLAFVAARRPSVERALQMAILGTMLVATMALSRIFGPLMLVPTVLAPLGIVLQGHPQRPMRIAIVIATVVASVLPLGLELAGLLPTSYMFAGGSMLVAPQMTNLPAWFVLGFLAASNIAIVVLPVLFVSRLRGELTNAQLREQVRSWHLSRLGDDLLRAAP